MERDQAQQSAGTSEYRRLLEAVDENHLDQNRDTVVFAQIHRRPRLLILETRDSKYTYTLYTKLVSAEGTTITANKF